MILEEICIQLGHFNLTPFASISTCVDSNWIRIHNTGLT